MLLTPSAETGRSLTRHASGLASCFVEDRITLRSHTHGQTWRASEPARSLAVSEAADLEPL